MFAVIRAVARTLFRLGVALFVAAALLIMVVVFWAKDRTWPWDPAPVPVTTVGP